MYEQYKTFISKEIESIKEAGLYKKERVITSPQFREEIKYIIFARITT
jgi:hypothetical protein